MAPRAHLQELPAEHIFERLAQELGFRAKQRDAERTLPPPLQRRITVLNVRSAHAVRSKAGNNVNLAVKFDPKNT